MLDEQSWTEKEQKSTQMATIRLIDVNKVFAQPLAGWRAQREQRLAGEESNEHTSQIKALDQVNLTVPNGQTIAVIGPSGCGKSTLLRVVAGLDGEYSGQVFYDDQEMTNLPPKDRYIGMVFQNYALYPHFEGHGNLSFFFRLRKISDQETEERIRITVLFLDEPTASLDPGGKREVEALIQAFADEGPTVVLSTHNLGQAKRLARRVLCLEAGRLLVDLPVERFFRDPLPAPAAQFLKGELPW